MLSLFNTPNWFHGYDLILDSIGLLIALLIAGYSYRIYRINRENRYMYFSLAFLSVALSFMFKVASSAVLYFTSVREITADVLMPLAGPELQFSALLYRGAFFMQMLLMLGAWLLIFFISQKARARLHKFYEVSQITLFIYLVVLISIVSNFKYFVFYLTGSVLLGLIVLNLYKNFLNTNRNQNAFRVMAAFLFLLAGNILFIFIFIHEGLYVAAEILQLVGFLILLYTYRRVTKR